MDRNSIIGFVLLLLLGTGYIFWNNHEQKAYLAQKAADSTAKAATMPAHVSGFRRDSAARESIPAADSGTASVIGLGNGDLNIQFTTRGGYPVQATLSHFKTYGGDSLVFFKGNDNRLSFNIPLNGRTVATSQLYFTPQVLTLAGGGKQLVMTSEAAPGKKVILTYALPEKGYMMSASLQLEGFQQDLSTVKTIPLAWNTEALKTEKDMQNERYYMQVHFEYQDGDDDYFTVKRTPQKKLEKPVKWFSVRSHFFNSTLIADQTFGSGSFDAKEAESDSSVIVANSSDFQVPVTASDNFSFGFRWLISPNDYQLLKSYNLHLEEMISLGYGIFFFVKYISKWIIIPLFNFICSYVGNIGLAIILLILVIRLLLSFFTYKSHLSSAKMRVLKPELDELRKKYGDNQQQMGMEQMKLYRTAGVNPLGGCFPMLLQMPFLLAVYYFIPTAIQLRQSPFLWSKDLSTYDSILNLGFNIPMYGSHVSLFTLLMTATSLFLALYNKNMTGAGAPGGGDMNKAMKYMPYIMPFMFLGWFNSMAAGLTLYYTCSNLISMAQQFVIQKFIINEDAIHAKMQEKKNKPAGVSKWQERLEQMQKAQAERMKQRK